VRAGDVYVRMTSTAATAAAAEVAALSVVT